MNISVKKHISGKSIAIYIFATFFCGVNNFIVGQTISKELDSIYQLEKEDNEKLKLYYQLLKKYEDIEGYTQLGFDAHQIAKWLNKKDVTKPEAIKVLKKAISARIKAVPFDPDLLKRSYNNYGLYSYREKKYELAIEIYRDLISVPGSDYLVGRAYSKIGDCYRFLQDPYSAIDNYNKAFVFLKKRKNNAFLISNHIKIADALKFIRTDKKADQALKHLKKAEVLLLESQNTNERNLYVVYNNTGGWYYEILHDTLSSQKYYEKALKQATKLGIKEYISKTSYNLGLSNIHNNNEEAKKYFEQSLKNLGGDPSFPRTIYIGIGLLENSNKNYEKATRSYFKSLSIFFDKEVNIDNISLILNKKEISSINNKMLLLEVLKASIDNYIDQGIYEKNVEHHKKAIALVKISDKLIDLILKENISDNTKLLWRSIASGTYASGIEASFEANEMDYGFYLSEKNKALLLIQEISKEKITIPSSILKEESKSKMNILNLEEGYSTASGKTKDSIFDLLFTQKQKLQSYKDSIASSYPDYKTTLQIPEITPLSNISYDDDQIIIQYMMTERISGLFPNTYCLILSKDFQKLIKLENTKSLQDKIYKLREQLNAPFRNEEDIISYREKSHNLYTSLIPKEIRPLLKDKKITIIPDHLIATIPFEALVCDLSSGKYLIEDSEINYTYSLSFQKQNTNRERFAKKEFLGIAPRDFDNDLTSLKNTTKEVTRANSYYSGLLLLNEEATKDNFVKELSDYKIIHLATHAFATDSITPWIAFQDQKMINPEIDFLKNNAEMVVLSACNTSLGEVRSGEGVLSLARGFFKSGANTVIPSLWSTNDKATATITSDFYKNLSEGQTKSAALRTAKLNYLYNNTDAEASPHYWASLILIGDSGTLLPQSNNLLFLWIGLILITLVFAIYRFAFYKKK
ncbi:CHAT domain-containing protein [Aquimarina sp. 2201CG14-23]|uniref:CHAT domain-containing protein n=1 Tax=Aquimarina mycalae TaxID=3040073 RepID=UPI002477F4D4|nr:CHAT domain-containing tetratricopeptide repeat protein [Aquimarina sp. 2201CG14-23]MDH7446930.1 CHAT domain-containing protein [Aquimarina sp. 2201CG14-23]